MQPTAYTLQLTPTRAKLNQGGWVERSTAYTCSLQLTVYSLQFIVYRYPFPFTVQLAVGRLILTFFTLPFQFDMNSNKAISIPALSSKYMDVLANFKVLLRLWAI